MNGLVAELGGAQWGGSGRAGARAVSMGSGGSTEHRSSGPGARRVSGGFPAGRGSQSSITRNPGPAASPCCLASRGTA